MRKEKTRSLKTRWLNFWNFQILGVVAFFGGFLVVSQVSGVHRKVQELQGFQDLGHLSKPVHGCPKTKRNTKAIFMNLRFLRVSSVLPPRTL